MAKHFSHPHKLHPLEDHRQITCSGCEARIAGQAYECREKDCGFSLHKKCFDLSREIRHESHIGHSLALCPVPTYPDGGFQCNACALDGSAFVYHCTVPGCNFDLHVHCAAKPRTFRSRGHDHSLTLLYSLPEDSSVHKSCCGVCKRGFPRGFWAYFCEECKGYGEHLECEFVAQEEARQSSNEQQQPRRQHGGDDENEMVVIRRGDLNKLYKIIESKDSVISTYHMANFRLQNQLNLLNMRNLLRR